MEKKFEPEDFLNYLERGLDSEVRSFFNILNSKLDIIIFSGVIRDFALGYLGPVRDLDLVVTKDFDSLEALLQNTKGIRYRKNSFGGFKISISNLEIDIWDINNTWAFNGERMNKSLFIDYSLTESCFFNFSSIIFKMKNRKFIGSKYFSEFLKEQKLDIVLSNNPYPELCIINTFYYRKKYDLKLSKYLKSYIYKNFFEIESSKFDSIQRKHFDKIIFPYSTLKEEVKKLVRNKNNEKAV